MLFKEVIGQEPIKRQLIRSANMNRVSHALLLAGSAGTGNFALALAFAQYLQCSNRNENDSCGICPSCVQASKFIHPDIHYVYPVAKTAKIKELVKGVDEPFSDLFLPIWREFLGRSAYPSIHSWYAEMGIENQQAGIFKKEAQEILRKLSFKSFESDHKVLLVWMPEKMNTTTANKLLKIIEEPPVQTVFLFITSHPEDLLPTIISRTQIIKIPPMPDDVLRTRLKEEYPDAGDRIEDALKLAQGDYVRAVERIQMNDQIAGYREQFIKWTRLVFQMKYLELQAVISELSEMGRERQKAFLTYSLGLVRQNLILNLQLDEIAFMDQDEALFSNRFNTFIHSRNVAGIARELETAATQISMNANPKILFTDLSFKLCDLLRMAR